jgi:hypothetical protein
MTMREFALAVFVTAFLLFLAGIFVVPLLF